VPVPSSKLEPQASASPPPGTGGGGGGRVTNSTAGEGGEGSQFGRLEKSLALCLLCGRKGNLERPEPFQDMAANGDSTSAAPCDGDSSAVAGDDCVLPATIAFASDDSVCQRWLLINNERKAWTGRRQRMQCIRIE
jgi:hypothetical protein